MELRIWLGDITTINVDAANARSERSWHLWEWRDTAHGDTNE